MDRVIAYGGPATATAALKTRATVVSEPLVRVLEALLLGHIVVVSFQMLLRAMVFDMSFYRDILLLLAVGLWAMMALREMAQARSARLNFLDRLVALYLIYGVLTTLVALIVNNVGLTEALSQFRNNFLPATLFFAAKKAFSQPQAQARLINLLIILGLIFILDAIVEFAILQMGVSPYKIPWYPFMFRVQNYFIGSETSGSQFAYLHPEDTPPLGLLGFPNFTVPALMALFAFSYPFLIHRFKVVWATLVGLLALLAVLIFNVQTHLVSGLVVLMALPVLIEPKWLKRNLIILVFAALTLFSIDSLRSNLVSSAQLRFLGDQINRSHLEVIFDKNQVAYLANSALPQLLFGNANVGSADFSDAEAWEFRLLFFTAAYGLVWLVLFLGIYGSGFIYGLRLSRAPDVPPIVRLFGLGTIGMLTVYMLDMGHYARPMWVPNIDIWVVTLGALSALVYHLKLEKPRPTLRSVLSVRRAKLQAMLDGEV